MDYKEWIENQKQKYGEEGVIDWVKNELYEYMDSAYIEKCIDGINEDYLFELAHCKSWEDAEDIAAKWIV